MKVSEYFVQKLTEYNVTDTFGIPGGVILKLLYEMNNTIPKLTPHLNYHEQMAGFAACGYAQASGNLGVAYATRGPGITNMITSIAEAYQESLPVLFITAHGNRPNGSMRFENNQELDTIAMVSGITKYAANIDDVTEVKVVLDKACRVAVEGRKGPVLVDVHASLWGKEIDVDSNMNIGADKVENVEDPLDNIYKAMEVASRPVILIGDGVRHIQDRNVIWNWVDKLNIPVLSSRGAQDILCGSSLYFGYVGSHGTRYSNFILSKADLIVAIGNRLAFPINSASFSPIVKNAKLIRVDIDNTEFEREIEDAENYKLDAKNIFINNQFEISTVKRDDHWIDICRMLKRDLVDEDCIQIVDDLKSFIEKSNIEIFVSDVGNNEFWLSRAFERAGKRGTLLCSKSFGTLGVALGKAIGTYYATRKPIVCVIGDQGFQYNLQELQYIAKWRLPIKIIVINNSCSAMIADHEKGLSFEKLIHVNEECGYKSLNIKAIADAYEIKYTISEKEAINYIDGPLIYEIRMDRDVELIPNLPKGNLCQDMEPLLERGRFDYLNSL